MIDLDAIRKRHEALTAPTGQAHARAVMRRHAPCAVVIESDRHREEA